MFIVFLLYFGLACGVVVPAFTGLIRTGVHLAETMISSFEQRSERVGAWCGFAAAVAVCAYAITPQVLQMLPDHRTRGDGGIGMIFNFVTQFAAYLLCPATVVMLIGLLMHSLMRAAGWKS